MKLSDRRAMLRLTAALALAPLLSTRAVFAAAAQPARSIRPPAYPMIYSRSLQRELPGGAMFEVSRRFAVQFKPDNGGFSIWGEQVSAEVDAPDSLSVLADLERQRIENGLFPLQLDSSGQIISGAVTDDATRVEMALQEVSLQIATLERAADEKAELQQFVNAVQQAGARLTTHLPPDLFAPVQTEREANRALVLPGGTAGQINTRFQAAKDADTGLMQHAVREVLTSLDGQQRRIVERWTLAPQDGIQPA